MDNPNSYYFGKIIEILLSQVVNFILNMNSPNSKGFNWVLLLRIHFHQRRAADSPAKVSNSFQLGSRQNHRSHFLYSRVHLGCLCDCANNRLLLYGLSCCTMGDKSGNVLFAVVMWVLLGGVSRLNLSEPGSLELVKILTMRTETTNMAWRGVQQTTANHWWGKLFLSLRLVFSSRLGQEERWPPSVLSSSQVSAKCRSSFSLFEAQNDPKWTNEVESPAAQFLPRCCCSCCCCCCCCSSSSSSSNYFILMWLKL